MLAEITADQAKEIINILDAIGYIVTCIAVCVFGFVSVVFVPMIRRYLARYWDFFK